MGHFIRQRWRRWLHRRLPRDDHRRFSQRNIFILPTGAGAVFMLLLLIMLLTGINYQNSLIYLLTFLLGTLFVAAMHHTHSNLSGLELTLVSAGSGFAGDAIPLQFRVEAGRHGAPAVSFSSEDTTVTLHIPSSQPLDFSLPVSSRRRGYLLPRRIRVETRFPFGLLKAWSWLRPQTPAIVYPRPLSGPEAGSQVTEGASDAAQSVPHGNDHADIRPWREGDLSQRVLWKRFARTGDMVVADWEGEQGDPQWLDFEAYAGVDHELRLNYLAGAVVSRSSAPTPFGLRLPGDVIEPDQGPAHAQRCLKALAVFGLQRPREGDPAVHGSRQGLDSAAPREKSA